jgi:acyl-CoA synthetase (NDP forming)
VPDVAGSTAGRGSVPSYPAVEAAVRALARVVEYSVWVRTPDGSPAEAGEVDPVAAKALVGRLLADAEGEVELSRDDTRDLLATYGIELWPAIPVQELGEAHRAAEELGWNVVLKATESSVRERPDLAHVWRNIAGPDDMADAWANLHEVLADPAQGAFVVQKNAPPGVPIAVRSFEDPLFGPVVSFGISGPVIELLGDWSYRIPPLDQHDVASMVREVKSSPLLFGYRGAELVDVESVERLVTKVAQLQNDLPQISSVDLSLVLAGASSVNVLTATVRATPVRDPRPDSFVRRLSDVTVTIPE